MTDEVFLDKVRKMLRWEEGVCDARVYDDATGLTIQAPVGNVTLGIGHNLDAKPLPIQVVELLLTYDIEDAIRDSKAFIADFDDLPDENQKIAIINMAFTLGPKRLAGFVKFKEAVLSKDWKGAALQIRNSKWYQEAKARAERTARMIEQNSFPY